MHRSHPQHSLMLLLLLLLPLLTQGCVEEERQALLDLKRGLIEDYYNFLESWNSSSSSQEDCCGWFGIKCRWNGEGHVIIRLDLSAAELSGKISPSLLSLKHLEYLDLSDNRFFQGNPIPPFIGNFSKLTTLNLACSGFAGPIPPQLGMLRNLKHLDLSLNYFLPGTPIPAFIGNFSNLTTLNLANAGFGAGFGAIPPQLGMLRNLEVLDLSGNDFLLQGTPIPAFIGNLSNLIRLNLYDAGLGGAIPPQLGTLQNLEHLDLSDNHFLQGTPIPPFIGSFSNLTKLSLADAGFGGALPPQLGMLRNLEQLDLSTNDFQGTPIPPFIGNFSNLTTLDLSNAGLGGAIPPQLGMLRNLEHLDLSGNHFRGAIPPQLGMLRNLQDLIISTSLDSSGEKTSFNPLLYVEDFGWISNLSSLETLGFQNVDMGRASDWESSLSRCPLLRRLTLESCNLGALHHGGIPSSPSPGNGFASLQTLNLHGSKFGKSYIPTWIFSLNKLNHLNLTDCSLDGVLTEHHFGSNLTSLETLHMSNNPLLRIEINPHWVPPFNLISLDLSSCQVGPELPLWIRTQENLYDLFLPSAGLQDSLPTWIWDFSSTLNKLDLSSNNFKGQLPALSSSEIGYLDLSHNSFSGCLSRFLCHDGLGSTSLYYLDLDNNLFSGNMSDCWDRWTGLSFVSIRNNNLTGSFSNSLANLSYLISLHLRNNSLSGSLTFLEKHNWRYLMITLDLGINKFNGNMNNTYWKTISNLRFLLLDSNEISGIIPREMCNLENLQILNLATNNLSGTIPTCFKNFRGMKVKPEFPNFDVANGSNYEILQLVLKGRVDEYGKTLGLVTNLDISNNHLSGKIPKELMNLTWLYSFNLSRNQLSGPIPMNIGNMRLLSSLDLSMNQLFGEIPSTISQVTRLDHFNVSHNHLTGRIPISTQLQSFDPSSYIGNTLCGKPLPEKCDQGDASSPTMNEHDAGDYKDDSLVGLYIGFPIGFGAGASTMFIILLFQSSWRFSFFYFIDRTLNKLF